MPQRLKSSRKEAAARDALRRRVSRWQERFNSDRWHECFALVDPRLTGDGKVNEARYVQSLGEFKSRYGSIRSWHVRISMHLTGSKSASDPRPFAYVYIVWQDDRHAFHMFRERWVCDGGRWYTRVAGLVVNETQLNQAG